MRSSLFLCFAFHGPTFPGPKVATWAERELMLVEFATAIGARKPGGSPLQLVVSATCPFGP